MKGVVENFSSDKYFGMKVLVSGNIPPASGLSSSSALVSAATLTTSYANKVYRFVLELNPNSKTLE